MIAEAIEMRKEERKIFASIVIRAIQNPLHDQTANTRRFVWNAIAESNPDVFTRISENATTKRVTPALYRSAPIVLPHSAACTSRYLLPIHATETH
jgi:hypothetical protein